LGLSWENKEKGERRKEKVKKTDIISRRDFFIASPV